MRASRRATLVLVTTAHAHLYTGLLPLPSKAAALKRRWEGLHVCGEGAGGSHTWSWSCPRHKTDTLCNSCKDYSLLKPSRDHTHGTEMHVLYAEHVERT